MSVRDRAPSLAFAALAALLAGLVATTFQGEGSAPASVTTVPGLLLADGRAPRAAAHRTIDRIDAGARTRGPWSLIVRRRTGSLGRGSAVVTWPVPALSPGRAVRIGGRAGTVGLGVVTWRTGPVRVARVRGDLSEGELLAIARAVRIASTGRPTAVLPDGLRVVWDGPYHPPVEREARYGAAEVGEASVLGDGLVFTSVQTGAEFEDGLFAAPAGVRPAGTIRGHPALAAPAPGNGVLAWEIRPGTVALVGWSGAPFGDGPIAALRRLAEHARSATPSAWQDLRPQRIDTAPAAVPSVPSTTATARAG